MALPTWPSSLPQYMKPESTSIEPLFDNIKKSPTESGMVKRRRQFTWVPDHLKTAIEVDGDQKKTLEDFYTNTLKSVLPFNWTDPTDQSVKAWKFVSGPKYDFDGETYNLWVVTLDLVEHRA